MTLLNILAILVKHELVKNFKAKMNKEHLNIFLNKIDIFGASMLNKQNYSYFIKHFGNIHVEVQIGCNVKARTNQKQSNIFLAKIDIFGASTILRQNDVYFIKHFRL